MHIAVMGSGGLGGYFGARLAAAGTPVTFIARGAHLQAMRAKGLRIRSEQLGDVLVQPVAATNDPAEIGPVDCVLFTVKLYDTESAVQAIRPLIRPETGVVTLQNGVESVDMLARILGREHVIGGAAYIPSVIAEPGVIQHTGRLARLVFGELDGRRSARVAKLLAAFTAAGVEARVSDQIEMEIWEKFVPLAAWSGVSAITRCAFGPVRDDPDTRALLIAAVEEVIAVVRGKGVGLSADAIERSRTMLLETAPAGGRASMLEDLERGKPLELPWFSGTVVRLGKELGVPTPTHAFIATALKPHVQGRGGQDRSPQPRQPQAPVRRHRSDR
jgi:2-dehydropantoate 2-reductase